MFVEDYCGGCCRVCQFVGGITKNACMSLIMLSYRWLSWFQSLGINGGVIKTKEVPIKLELCGGTFKNFGLDGVV